MADINHKLDNESATAIQRPKKPRSQAQIDATKKMLEGRKEWANNKGKENKAKKVAKLKAKIAKIDPQQDEEIIDGSDLSNSPILSTQKPLDENLLSNSVIENTTELNAVDDIEDIDTPPNDLEDNDDPLPSRPTRRNASNAKATPKGKKKKTIVNNYHYTASIDEDSSDEEIINNHYIPPKKSKKKSKKKVKMVAPESESSEEEEYEQQYIPQPKIGIRFV